MFQNYALWPHLTIEGNITLGLKNKKTPTREVAYKLQKLSEILQISPLLKRKPHEISGGQQQRASLARALAAEPKIILFDEPLSNLDKRLKEDVLEDLTRIHSELKTTFIYVTHDYLEALSVGTELAVMRNGEIIQTGSPPDVYQNPLDPFIAQFLGDSNLISGEYSEEDGVPLFNNSDLKLKLSGKLS